MIKLEAGNVLLKPSHRRQLMAWLKRPARIGQRLGNFVMTLAMSRTGRSYDVRASVSDSAGGFDCHCRRHDWRNAARDTARLVSVRLHSQNLQRGQ